MLTERRRIATSGDIDAALDRMAGHIAEIAGDAGDLALVGVRTGGVPLARRLADRIEARTGARPPVGSLDITLYRDDVFGSLEQPAVGPTDVSFDVAGRLLVLVDDVLYTGRTVRAAVDALMDLGRPRRILLAVLVDRGGRELPIAADVTGLEAEAGSGERVEVGLTETGAEDTVVVLAPGREEP